VLRRSESPRSRARLIAAAVLAALIGVVGLAAPATAATDLSVSGRVVFPTGYTYDANRPPTIEVLYVSGNLVGRFWGTPKATVRADGTFTYTHRTTRDNEHAATSFKVRLEDPQQQRLIRGYLAEGGTIAPEHTGGTKISAQATGLVLRPTIGVQITGRFAVPQGYEPSSLELEASYGSTPSYGRETHEAATDLATRTFVLGGLTPGQVLTLRFSEFFGPLYDGVVAVDGLVGGGPAQQFVAPASGVVITTHLSGSISGRLELPATFPEWDDRLYLEAVVNEQGDNEGYGWIEDDRTFRFSTLSTGREYALAVDSPSGELQPGFLGPDGTFVPAGHTDAEYAAAFRKARKIRPSASGLVFPVPESLGLRGRITVPPGATLPTTGSDAPAVVLLARNSRGEWSEQWKAYTDAKGSFAFPDLVEGREYLMWFDAYADRVSGRERYGRGYWTGNSSALTTDITKAKPVVPNRSRNLVIPLPVRSTTKPSVSGTAALGKKLWAKRGSWSPSPSSTTSVQWLRDGAAIPGATASSYVVTKADIGKRISVRETAKGPSGYSPASATSARTAAVPKIKPVVTVWVPSGIKAGKKVQVAVKVVASSVTSAPLGTVKVRVGLSTKTVTLKAADKGRVTVTMPAQKKGTYDVRAAYTPSSSAAPYLTSRTSPTLRVRIT